MEKVHLDNISSPGDLSHKRDQRNFFLLTAEETGVPCADVDLRQKNSTLPFLNPSYFRQGYPAHAKGGRLRLPEHSSLQCCIDSPLWTISIIFFYYFINTECTTNFQKLRYVIEKLL